MTAPGHEHGDPGAPEPLPTATFIVAAVADQPSDLFRTVGSLLAQPLVGDALRVRIVLAPTAPACGPVADALARRDPRRVAVSRSPGGAWVDLLAAGLEAVDTVFVGVLEPGDLALDDAVALLLHRAGRTPRPRLVHADEQWTGEDGQLVVRRKPHRSPTRLEADDYVGRPALVDVEHLRAIGGWRGGPGRAAEWDLHLRLVGERDGRVEHLPVVGVHRAAPPRATDADARATLDDHLRRTAHDVDDGVAVEPAAVPGMWRVVRARPDPPPLVSVVVPTAGTRRDVDGADTELVSRCLDGLLRHTDYPVWEAVVVVSAHAPPGLEDRLEAAAPERVRTVRLPPGDFNFSESVNAGVRLTRGPLVLLLNDDVAPLDPRWLSRMVATSQAPGVGVVGAKLLFPHGRLQHAGVAHDDLFRPIHPRMGEPDGTGDFGDLDVDVEYAAVTAACMLTTREIFEEVGGFWPGLPVAYGDVDFCWKAATRGHRSVLSAGAVLRHDESSSRAGGATEQELQGYHGQWIEHARHDLSVHLGVEKW